ncbi:MAG: endonuclease V [Aigarchaeota archaeon]|nr:endonuclease V [Aigarchaeota archaeon]MCX8192545.1 endonuclease V [Nitrososphaeria archaeon]MDW7985719.1 endonuclease V [Nitrososphaerota archaeon]
MESSQLLNKFYEKLQIAIARNLILGKGLDVSRLKNILAVDSAYRDGELMVTAGIIWDVEGEEMIKESYIISKPTYSYIPGLLYVREAPAILELVEKIDYPWDLLLVDGHGILHPRRAGLAVVVGFILDKPVVGVAKKLLVGKEVGEGREGPIYLDGELSGYWFKDEKKFYVSPGYKVRVEDIVGVIRLLGGRYPKPLEIADKLARKKISGV